MIKLATDCSGIGSPEEALKRLNIDFETVFSCEKDKFARQTYLANHQTTKMYEDMTARNNAEAPYSDLYIAGIPCQSFSLAGKRLGESDARGTLFYNFYDYVKHQQPKYFIIENVKGLLSMNNGSVFENWKQLLGRSENTHPFLFLHPESLEYNLHWEVLNSKRFGVPQNRERVFLIGIRKDLPNKFRFPVGFHLKKRLKDVLENSVDEKYYLSEKMVSYLIKNQDKRALPFITENEKFANFILKVYHKMPTDGQYLKVASMRGRYSETGTRFKKSEGPTEQHVELRDDNVTNTISTVTKDNFVIQLNKNKEFGDLPYQQNRYYDIKGISPTLNSSKGTGKNINIKINSATKKGYEIAKEGDSINFQNPTSKTRRGRVGVGVANTLDTSCSQAVIEDFRIRRLTPLECFRLQGYSDSFFYKSKYYSIKESNKILKENPKHKGKRILNNTERIERMSDSQLYQQAGNTITVDVIEAILNNLLTD